MPRGIHKAECVCHGVGVCVCVCISSSNCSTVAMRQKLTVSIIIKASSATISWISESKSYFTIAIQCY